MPEREPVPPQEVAAKIAAAERALEDAWVEAAGRPDWQPTAEQRVEALRRLVIDRDVAAFVSKVRLAAELYPEAIREALGSVFDTAAAEGWMKAVSVQANHAQAKLAELCTVKSWLEVEAGPALEDALRLAGEVEAVRRDNAALLKEVRDLRAKMVVAFDYLRELAKWAHKQGFEPPTAAKPQKKVTDGKDRGVPGPAAGKPGAGQAGPEGDVGGRHRPAG